VLGRTEGMFPFLLQVGSEIAVQNLRAFFKAQGFCLKQNTAFTLLKSQQVERSTFQVLSANLQRKRGTPHGLEIFLVSFFPFRRVKKSSGSFVRVKF
jgi:hypothetical protein